MGIVMDSTALLTLTQWLSPGFPVGAYSYSHGLERAVDRGDITDAVSLQAWFHDVITNGSGRNDVILLAHAFEAEDPQEVADVAEALSASAERHLETMTQGAAFSKTVAAVWGFDLPPLPYPVSVGRAAALAGLPLAETAQVYLHSFVANLVSAAVRFVPLGQTEGQRVLLQLKDIIAETADVALTEPLDNLGGAAFRADIAAMQHETMTTRIFRT